MKLNIKKYLSLVLSTNCYLLQFETDDSFKFSIVIDPCVDYNEIKKDISGELKAIFITHVHFDHFLKLDSYQETNALIYVHKNGVEKLTDPHKNCSDLFEFDVTASYSKSLIKPIEEGILALNFQNNRKNSEILTLNILELFGHSDCSISVGFEDKIFTGDFIFEYSYGRTDLYSGNYAELKNSLNKLNSFCDKAISENGYNDIIIYPGHGNKLHFNR